MSEDSDLLLDKTDRLLSISEAAERSNCDIRRIKTAIKAGEIVAVNLGLGKKQKRPRIRESELIRWWRHHEG